MSVYLCCLDVTYCLRCLVYWSPGHPPPASAASDSPPLGSLWERTMWRYWRCYTAMEDADPVFDHGKGPFIACFLLIINILQPFRMFKKYELSEKMQMFLVPS